MQGVNTAILSVSNVLSYQDGADVQQRRLECVKTYRKHFAYDARPTVNRREETGKRGIEWVP